MSFSVGEREASSHDDHIRQYDSVHHIAQSLALGLADVMAGSLSTVYLLPKYEAPDLVSQTQTFNALNTSMHEAAGKLYADVLTARAPDSETLAEYTRKLHVKQGALDSIPSAGQEDFLHTIASRLTTRSTRTEFTSSDVHRDLVNDVRGSSTGDRLLPRPSQVNIQELPPNSQRSGSLYNERVAEYNREFSSARAGYVKSYASDVRTIQRSALASLGALGVNTALDLTLFSNRTDSPYSAIVDAMSQTFAGCLAARFGPKAMVIPVAAHVLEKLAVERSL